MTKNVKILYPYNTKEGKNDWEVLTIS